MMSDCPTTDRLRRLLEEGSPESQPADLVAHLEICPRCQETLDRLVARSGLWNELPLLRDVDLSCPPTIDLVDDSEESWPDDDELPLGLLEPSDEPGHLGRLGPYDVIRLIGRGGMGLVFLARDRALDRSVAIKILTPGLAATAAARRRFAREAKAAAAVVHEHVVTIHAVDTLPQGIPYLVMQYVSGKSVQDVIDRGKAPELAEILRIGSQAAGALAAAHAQGLIHRDIKPANILLENGVERVKITDFGLARTVDDATLSQSGVVAGTPQYMSPEQAAGEAVDHRTDLFSLGSVLYALCTGRTAFRGTSSMATLRKVCEQKPRPIQEFNTDIPSWLIAIIEKLHAKDPADRYESAAEVADLLGRCLAHVQQPASVPLPAELRPARKPRVMALWGSLSIGLVLASVLGWPGAREAAAQAVSYMATVLRLTTPEGTLVVEADDPNVGIKLDGSELVVTGAGVKELRLSVGEHNVQTMKDGKLLQEELVTISRGGRTILRVRKEKEAEAPLSTAELSMEKLRHKLAPPSPTVPTFEGRIQPPTGPSRSALVATFRPDGSEVRSVCFSPDGRVVFFGTKGGQVGRSSQLRIGSSVADLSHTSIEAHQGGAEGVAISPDGRTMVTGGQDHHVKLWDVLGVNAPLPTRPTWDFDGFNKAVRSVAVSADGKLVAAGGFDKILVVLDAKDGKRVWTSPTLDQPINGIAFSPDGQLIALAMGDYTKGNQGELDGQPGEVQVWNWPRRERIATMRGWRRECKSVVFDSTGRFLAVTSAGEGFVRLYACDGDSCKERGVLDGGPWSAGVAFRPDSLVLANSNWNGQVKFWNAATQKLGESLWAHQENVPCIAFSPDGRFLATASSDGTVRVWSMHGTSVTPIAERANLRPNELPDVRRLADALESEAPKVAAKPNTGMRLYMRDLTARRTTPIFDSSSLGRPYAEIPTWSHDGRRILFHIQPRKNDWSDSRVIAIEQKDGRVEHRDLGAGCCASPSPDGNTIAFLLPGERVGVWLMNADGTDRRPVCEAGSPSWSPDGTQLLLNDWTEPNAVRIYSLATKQVEKINLPGHKIYSWPSWTGPNQLVACIDESGKPDSLVLMDVSTPSESRIVRTMWQRAAERGYVPRWPIVSAETRHGYFICDTGGRRMIFELAPESSGMKVRVVHAVGGPKLSGLSLSPDGQYLIFAADQLDSELGRDSSVRTAAREAVRLVEAVREHPPRSDAERVGSRMQIYIRDLVEGKTTLVADKPIPERDWCADPDWSHDGKKILFGASTDMATSSRLMLLDSPDGQPRTRDLGPGRWGKFSADDRQIVFAMTDGDATDQSGIWVMKSDGTDRRRLNIEVLGTPSWSEDQRQLLISTFEDPATSYIHDFRTGKTTRVEVPGLKIFSWPRWAGHNTLVACLGAGDQPGSIGLIDVSRPGMARVERQLWSQSDGPDIYARWPLFEPPTETCYFLGTRGAVRSILKASSSPEKPGAIPVEGGERPDGMGGLNVSPDGRFLIFNAQRSD